MHRYWLLLLVLAFGLLSIYTSQPIYGAPVAVPTADVNTIPERPETPTPENTPFPTPTAVNNESPSDSGSDDSAPIDDHNADNNSDDSAPTGNNTADTAGGIGSPDAGSAAEGATTFETKGATGNTGLVTAVTLNLRKEPSATARVVDTLFLNDEVTILGRNQNGNWWYVCCGARTQANGWVSKQFIAANLSAAAIPLVSGVVSQAATVAGSNAAVAPAEGSLVLEMRSQPPAVQQGQLVEIQFVVRNRSNGALSGVQLRNDLPAELAVVNTQTGSQGKVNYTGALQSGPIFTINWPTVQANSQVTATVTVQIATDIADGALIDNLAVVKTTQGAEALAGITLALPPVALPQFR